MRSRFPALLMALLIGQVPAMPQVLTPSETGLKPEVLLLARIKVHMENVLTQQPNYTCVETIERSQRRRPSRRYKLLDTIRLEVALVDGAEMFSWPGESEFRSSDVRDIVSSGAIGSGSFASHARGAFISNTATYTYSGTETLNMMRVERFDYSVPLNLSGYTLTLDDREAVVPFHGSFWVDPGTLDVVRLVVHADDIPPTLGLSAVDTELWYERTTIGDSEFLLPSLGVTTLIHLNGDASRNEITFAGCRQYTGESVLSFAPPDELLNQPSSVETIELPGELEFQLELETGIVSGRTAVGDEVRARVRKDVKRKKQTLIRKGAIVTGRLRHLEKVVKGIPYYVVAIEFDRLEDGDRRADLTAELLSFDSWLPGGGRPSRDPNTLFPRGGVSFVTIPHLEAIPGIGVFYAKGGTLDIPPGSRMTWQTVEKPNGE